MPEEIAPTELEVVKVTNPGFIEKVTPKDSKDLMLLLCSKTPKDKEKCGGIHFRHAGYVQTMLPFMRPNQDKKVELTSYQVMVCVKCKTCYVWAYDQLYDVTDRVDLNAWEATERELHKATGPGGQC